VETVEGRSAQVDAPAAVITARGRDLLRKLVLRNLLLEQTIWLGGRDTNSEWSDFLNW
jgi:hypothetical protein